jgi:hypothetical protein
MMLVTRIADLQRLVRVRFSSLGRLGAGSLLLVAVAAVSSCKEPDGSGLMSMFTQTPVPAEYANKAWKVEDEGCSYIVGFDNRSIRTDLIQCGGKVAFNKYKTVASATESATEFGAKFTSVAIAQVGCKKRAKNAGEMNVFYAKMNSDGSLTVRTNNQPLSSSPFDFEQLESLVRAAPADGTACVN